ncbi:calcium-activated chloride channel-domain-containing protein [Russula brevipes]|nr:calcium-activated chloride channel-domain-containing protein [Russula brevipes]
MLPLPSRHLPSLRSSHTLASLSPPLSMFPLARLSWTPYNESSPHPLRLLPGFTPLTRADVPFLCLIWVQPAPNSIARVSRSRCLLTRLRIRGSTFSSKSAFRSSHVPSHRSARASVGPPCPVPTRVTRRKNVLGSRTRRTAPRATNVNSSSVSVERCRFPSMTSSPIKRNGHQFGYVALWSTIWPLAPLMALLNNVVEFPSDVFKILTHFRHPLPKRTDTIGPWLDCLSFLAWLSALSNSALVYLFRPRALAAAAAQQQAANRTTTPLLILLPPLATWHARRCARSSRARSSSRSPPATGSSSCAAPCATCSSAHCGSAAPRRHGWTRPRGRSGSGICPGPRVQIRAQGQG